MRLRVFDIHTVILFQIIGNKHQPNEKGVSKWIIWTRIIDKCKHLVLKKHSNPFFQLNLCNQPTIMKVISQWVKSVLKNWFIIVMDHEWCSFSDVSTYYRINSSRNKSFNQWKLLNGSKMHVKQTYAFRINVKSENSMRWLRFCIAYEILNRRVSKRIEIGFN